MSNKTGPYSYAQRNEYWSVLPPYVLNAYADRNLTGKKTAVLKLELERDVHCLLRLLVPDGSLFFSWLWDDDGGKKERFLCFTRRGEKKNDFILSRWEISFIIPFYLATSLRTTSVKKLSADRERRFLDHRIKKTARRDPERDLLGSNRFDIIFFFWDCRIEVAISCVTTTLVFAQWRRNLPRRH